MNTNQVVPMADGGRAIDLVHGGYCYGGGLGKISQTVPTVVGTSDRLAFKLAAPRSGDTCSHRSSGPPYRTARVTVGSVQTTFTAATSSFLATAWESKQVTFTATSNATAISFQQPDVDDGYWGPMIDLVSVVELDSDSDGAGDACDADDDNDLIGDAADQCEGTEDGAVVDSASGCSIAQLCPCFGPMGSDVEWGKADQYTECVKHAATAFRKKALITKADSTMINAAAASSSCGRNPCNVVLWRGDDIVVQGLDGYFKKGRAQVELVADYGTASHGGVKNLSLERQGDGVAVLGNHRQDEFFRELGQVRMMATVTNDADLVRSEFCD